MNLINKLTRKKHISETDAENSDLTRCLSLWNLVSVGVGSTLGAGVYVLAGAVAKNDAGPSIILSFCVAAFASLLAGLCYAEFGARVPKAGSAYIYSYVTVGQFCGFIIGWNLILEYIIGVSSVARAWSANLDSLTGGVIANVSRTAMPMNVAGFASYPDFLSVALILVITVLLSIGMKVSSLLITVLTLVNVVVLCFCAIAGFIKANPHNWNLKPSEVQGHGNGGFMPFGFSKMMEGAASCFYAFVGFDTIACVGEEAKNPSKNIPRSIVITLATCLVAYVSVSSALTLMQPYYLLDENAPLPNAFVYVHMGWASKPIAVGSMCALIASVLGAAVGMPRIVFAMARDGLIFSIFSQVSSKSHTPIVATIVSGILSALMALVFDLEDLVNMMSIGTLMAYTLVACSVLLLRFRPDSEDEPNPIVDQDQYSIRRLLFPNTNMPTSTTSSLVNFVILFSVACMILLGVLLVWGEGNLEKWWGIFLAVVLLILLIFCLVVIWRQPKSSKQLSFQTPLVPIVPVFSMAFNIYLMLKLPTMTWVRFAVWMVVGFIMYFGYGIRQKEAEEEPLLANDESFEE
uniref:High affinity cationic amino acid transporter 1 n=1 Tax=Phallusia mammillata TaxID=59560 RepID=A0A6F9DTM3_9ASCI|nr:high affinity cationic amino acid transporter 1 [Phallusia mammillata]